MQGKYDEEEHNYEKYGFVVSEEESDDEDSDGEGGKKKKKRKRFRKTKKHLEMTEDDFDLVNDNKREQSGYVEDDVLDKHTVVAGTNR